MSKKLTITVIAATVAASLAITPAAKAGHRGLGTRPRNSRRRRDGAAGPSGSSKARKAAEARARMRAQAQARAAAARKQEIAAQKAAAAKAAKAEKANDDAIATTTNSTPSTYVAAPSSTAVLTQTDVAGSQAEHGDRCGDGQQRPVDGRGRDRDRLDRRGACRRDEGRRRPSEPAELQALRSGARRCGLGGLLSKSSRGPRLHAGPRSLPNISGPDSHSHNEGADLSRETSSGRCHGIRQASAPLLDPGLFFCGPVNHASA